MLLSVLIILPLPPPALETVSVYCLVPFWLIVSICAAIVMVPVRALLSVFAETE
jgi:hypothetical protein